jgi:Zn-dependent protease with chaperone function
VIRAYILALALTATLANAADASESALDSQDLRLKSIGHRLAEANAIYCPKRQRIPGASTEQPPVCASTFWVDARSKRDAGANGEQVRVTSGLIDFLSEDDELAAVAAHEIAHNQLGHPALLDGLKKGRAKAVRATEIEADQLAVWLLANAGYDPRAAIRMWQRLGPRQSRSPRLAERVTIIEREIAALNATEPIDGKRSPALLALLKRNGQIETE